MQVGANWCSLVEGGAVWDRLFSLEQDGTAWCKVVQLGACWCSLVQVGPLCCKMVHVDPL